METVPVSVPVPDVSVSVSVSVQMPDDDKLDAADSVLKKAIQACAFSWYQREETAQQMIREFYNDKYTIDLFLLDEARHKATIAKTCLSPVDYGLYTKDQEIMTRLTGQMADQEVRQKRLRAIEKVNDEFEELKNDVYGNDDVCSICLTPIYNDQYESDVERESNDGDSDWEENPTWIKKCNKKWINKKKGETKDVANKNVENKNVEKSKDDNTEANNDEANNGEAKGAPSFASGCYYPRHLICQSCIPTVMDQDNCIECVMCNKKRRICK